MALLAKYYLSCNSMGMDNDSDSLRRRAYHGDATGAGWRPAVVANASNNGGAIGPTSAPNSPRVPRKSTWHTSGNRGSCDGESFQTVNTQPPQRRGGSVRLSSTSGARRSGSMRRRASPLHVRRDIVEQEGAVSAPTSPHFGIDKNELSTKSPLAITPRAEKSTPSSPLHNTTTGEQHGQQHARHSPPVRSPKSDSKNQSFAGVTNGDEYETVASPPPHSGGSGGGESHSPKDFKRSESFLTRRRCTSGPLNEHAKAKSEEAVPKMPELLITLSYSKNLSFVTATINRARNLTENTGAFVRVHMYEGFKPISMKQTSTMPAGVDVEFKQAFVFSLSKDGLWATHILIELFEHDVIGNECKYGDVVVGPKAGGTGFAQWRQMCTHPNIPCSMWHAVE